jgi:hypothetical protein
VIPWIINGSAVHGRTTTWPVWAEQLINAFQQTQLSTDEERGLAHNIELPR